MQLFESLKEHWQILYPAENDASLLAFANEIENQKGNINYPAHQPEWYKDAIIYSLYVDLFSNDFDGLIEKLDYLQDLGVNCLWLLPVLDSPMKDAGFDIISSEDEWETEPKGPVRFRWIVAKKC